MTEASGSAADLNVLKQKVRGPVAVILGAVGEVGQLLADLQPEKVVCFQLDLVQAERLREELRGRGLDAEVVTAPDLWDLPGDFQTVIYPAPLGGERSLKIDMVEQAFHVLRPRGLLLVRSPYEADQFFPGALKKVFGRVHAPPTARGQIFWCQRDGDRPRRRHEVTFHVRREEGPPLIFLSRPGVFSYGHFDDGARALVEAMQIDASDRLADLGCGCGTNGIIAGLRSGPGASVTFIDSNLRALALADHNARANALTRFEVVASNGVKDLPPGGFDLVLANPPYFPESVTHLFIDTARTLLRPGGRLYLVTKQPNQVGPLVAEAFGPTQVVAKRGYAVLCAEA